MSATLVAEGVDAKGLVICRLCDSTHHIIQTHLASDHPGVSLADYEHQFPGAPILSEKARKMIEDRLAKRLAETADTASVEFTSGFTRETAHFHDVFGLGSVPAALSSQGKPIPIEKITPPTELQGFVPKVDNAYVFDIDGLKTVILGIETRIPTLLWGHMGTGKSSLFEQVCARTNRPMIRCQHTGNTEESHVVGQWVVREGQTVYQLGPLAYAMRHGLTYLADEYDFAMPAVVALYQPVLEGKALVIKEADEANRIIEPHPMFRFVATGNTNGTGDETGLYQGTLIQNAANYERFGIVRQVHYLEAKSEISILVGKTGIQTADAKKLVEFANMIRESFNNKKISVPMSPRALLYAATIGKRFASYSKGLELAFVNRLPSMDQDAALQVIKRLGF